MYGSILISRGEYKAKCASASIATHAFMCMVISQLEPPHDKTNEMACAPSEDSDQPGRAPSLIRVFAVR